MPTVPSLVFTSIATRSSNTLQDSKEERRVTRASIRWGNSQPEPKVRPDILPLCCYTRTGECARTPTQQQPRPLFGVRRTNRARAHTLGASLRFAQTVDRDVTSRAAKSLPGG